MPNAIWLEGAVNAVNIVKNNFANVDTCIRLLAADRTGTNTANAATIPNGVNITHNWFEGILDGIKFNGNTTTTNKSRSVGLIVDHNRIEAVSVSGTSTTTASILTAKPRRLSVRIMSIADRGGGTYPTRIH
ncbi:hypothetical protein JQ582_30270 [Bradyrhizobium japonicum]|uniref:hypothetical protein n=1 Tax=Bradyrhizobium japonicum TaxID=375 RepID=UPI001BA887FC|nr:hypothetical protein [Bradyrhizobium japonicum]MBR0748226.1 hypothetical protein [Bradyrhizobium japonicum]